MKALIPYIVQTAEMAKMKHEVHSFPSGAFMIDISVAGRFYVIQIYQETIGLSEVTKETIPFEIIPDQSFTEVTAFKHAFESIFLSAPREKAIIINGNNFSTLEGFHVEIDNVLTKDLNWKTGHNLDAFNDLLRGGFGVHDYQEPIKIIWLHSDKSKSDLHTMKSGQPVYQTITEIIREHPHIEFVEN